MTKKEYDQLSSLYQIFTERFDSDQPYKYDGYYKCYCPRHYAVSDENLAALKYFTNLKFSDIYTKSHVYQYGFHDTYLNAKLVKIEKERICVVLELG
jgi:hypothetical protein